MSLMNETALASNVVRLLRVLDSEDLLAVARTATNNRILPLSSKEAIETILLHTPDLGRLFSYRRLTTQVLFQYLHSQDIPSTTYTTKQQLVAAIQEYWESKGRKEKKTSVQQSVKRKSFSKPEAESPKGRRETAVCVKESLYNRNIGKKTDEHISATGQYVGDTSSGSERWSGHTMGAARNVTINNQTVNITVDQNLLHINNPSGVHSGRTSQSPVQMRSDKFALDFCEWYYVMVNRLQPHCHLEGDTFRQEVFFHNSSANVYIIGSTTSDEKHAQGQDGTYQLLINTFKEYGLLFSPNLSSGIQAHKSEHGMVKIFCCGTLHCKDSFVGIFEQEFGVVRSPVDNVWKIMTIKLNLKQSEVWGEPPSLPPCQVFEIQMPGQ